MKPRKVLDSFALLAYLQGEGGSSTVKEALASSDAGLAMNEINVGEVYYILARGRGRDQADFFLNAVLPNLPLRVCKIDFHDVIEAARIKAGHAISYADCFAVATARRENAALLTGDPELETVASLIKIEWI